jgi:hypothetical protein
VLISKGCDGLSQRYVRRLEARRDWATRDFEARWTQKLAPIETQLTAASATGDNQTRILQLETQKNQIIGDREKQRRNLEQTDWRDFNDSARQAEMTHRMSGFWREIAFFIGTFAFTGGLLALSLNGDGPERWMCLIILAILAFSLYVGGSSWGSG